MILEACIVRPAWNSVRCSGRAVVISTIALPPASAYPDRSRTYPSCCRDHERSVRWIRDAGSTSRSR